jgi:polysaccharide deacetylase 2 family uncharacterized protein YibQ
MRAGAVLAGMLVAAIAALLVWFDATGQLRPFLSTAPLVVIDLAPPAADPADAAQNASLDAPELEPDLEPGADAATEAVVPAPEATTADDTAEESNEAEVTAAADASAVDETAMDETPTDEAAADEAAADEAADDTPVEAPIALDPTDEAPVPASSDTDEPDMASEAADAAATVGDTPAPPPAKPAEQAAKPAEQAAKPAEQAAKPAEQAADAAENADAATDAGDGNASDTASTQTAALPSVPSGAELPWRRYAGEFSIADPRPRIAIVFTSLGLSDAAGDAIILHMPPGVTLAFSPYSRKLTEWIARAREDGHEVLVELPMEPLNYPDDDPGPLALLSTLPVQDNITRMDGILARADGVVGVAALMGSRFTTSSDLMRPLLTALGERGYVYVDNNAAPFSVLPTLAGEIAVPIAINDHYIDREASRIAIDGRLQQLERIARSEGAAVAFASPYPITIERLAAWIPTLEAKGFVLAPITAVAGRQRLP